MTPQEIFTKVATHLMTQKSRALREDGRCGYRGIDGTMCAVGCLIAPNAYRKEIEGEGVTNYAVMRVLASSGIYQESAPMLRDLQDIHDTVPTCFWKEKLEALAKQYNLEMP